jgi:hypothetical protein
MLNQVEIMIVKETYHIPEKSFFNTTESRSHNDQPMKLKEKLSRLFELHLVHRSQIEYHCCYMDGITY